ATPTEKKSEEFVPLGHYLETNRVMFFPTNESRDNVVQSLIGTMQLPDREEALRLIKEREEVGGILIRPNIAIPHATMNGIKGVEAALGIQQSSNGEQPFFWLVFISGEDSIQEHLEFLKSAAQTFTDDVVEQLSNVDSAEKAIRILSFN